MGKIKPLLLTIFLFAFIISLQAQKVTSKCTASDSVKAKYRTDADRLALRRVFKTGSDYTDSTTIPKRWSDTVLNALLAVYNADSLPAKDTVVSYLKIHSFNEPVLNNFYMAADSILPWMQKLRKDSIPTGFDSIDFLLKKYQLHVLRYYRVKEFPYHIVILESNGNYNIDAITKQFEKIGGVHYANIGKTVGYGNDIKDKVDSTFVDLTYSVGWGDCESGCINMRYWKFRVYYDCSVEYFGSHGSKLNLIRISPLTQNKIKVQPNPFKDHLNLYDIHSQYEYKLYNSAGALVKNGMNNSDSISNLEDLPKGIYFLQILSENKLSQFKLMKD